MGKHPGTSEEREVKRYMLSYRKIYYKTAFIKITLWCRNRLTLMETTRETMK